ncbi:MAG: hypothetical protein GY854_09490 [Deltaproteobacteria bacterium]|nr:hypothetical protein [Deltaproteobacteria bacterium]
MKLYSSRGLCIAITTLLLIAACKEGSKSAKEQTGPDPLATVRELLRLHDLVGRQPEERSDETKKKEVDRGTLGTLIADLDAEGKFISDVYVGFVVGALARNQGRLFVSRKGERAWVTAGTVKVVLKLKGGIWKIVLSETVPAEIKKRAALSKAQFDQAKKKN